MKLISLNLSRAFRGKLKKSFIFMSLLVTAMLLQSCATVGYYSQSVRGHMSIWFGRQDIEQKLVATGEDELSPEAQRWLRRVLQIRSFATRSLALPDNYSFKSYTNIGRAHVLWNVVAAPEFSLSPKRFCFPIAGCLSYKGYFAKTAALKEAGRLRAKGYDVYVGAVSAYSTLGWFADPVLSSFINWTEDVLSGLIFHELTHQVVYVKGDTVFNESFATVVEMEGITRWMKERNKPELVKLSRLNKVREAQFIEMVLKYKRTLSKLYQTKFKASDKRVQKRKIIENLRIDYSRLKKKWGGFKGYDHWMSHSLNNAKLASLSTYYKFVPAFQQLLKNVENNLPQFYREVERIGAMPIAQRHFTLLKLLRKK